MMPKVTFCTLLLLMACTTPTPEPTRFLNYDENAGVLRSAVVRYQDAEGRTVDLRDPPHSSTVPAVVSRPSMPARTP